MAKKLTQNPLVRIVLLLLAVFVVVIAIAQIMAKSMVSDFLIRKLPQHVQLEYKDIDVNVIHGSISLKDIAISLYDRDSMLVHTKLVMDQISLNGLSYWQFFVKKNIAIDELNLQQPEVVHYLNKILPKKDKERQGVVGLLKTIEIEALKVIDGQLDVFQGDNDSLAFQAKDVDFSLMDARTGPKQIKERIPITYGNYHLATEDIFVDLGPYEQLKVGNIVLDNGDATLRELDLRSKFSKAELSKRINVEHDHFILKIPETTMNAIEVGYKNDTLFVTTGSGKITEPNADIYRDKLVADNFENKRLYSRMLRELPFRLNVPKFEIVNGRISYSQRIETKVAPGKISFNDLNAVLLNVSNDPKANEKVTISAEAKLMDHAPIKLDWTFDVNNTLDAFTASGVIKDFRTESMNEFLESNLRAKGKGTIDRMYFTISGNTHSSAGDMKMKYKNFEFSVLKKNRLGVNKLLTAIGKIFINDGSNADANGFRYGYIEVERDPTKSFFNYLWLNVRDGTVNTLVGKSEKK